MPADSGAAWRYRIYDVDYITHVFDILIFLNGADTTANGNTYHKLLSRNANSVVPNDSAPPVVSLDATFPDTYYGAIRESGKKEYSLNATGGGETLMFDFNVSVGDSIPAYSGMVRVTGIDSIMLSGVYHKRYLTNDTTYYVIEGVGSSRGLFPDLNDGGSDIAFYCFTDSLITYSPDPTIPCTYIYPVGYTSAAGNINNTNAGIELYPVPTNDMLHILLPGNIYGTQAIVTNILGQVVWQGVFDGKLDISVRSWPRGVYDLHLDSGSIGHITKQFAVQ